MPTYLTQIRDYYYYFRRIPSHLKAYDSRQAVRVSLKTKDRRQAERRAAIHDDFMEQYWAELVRTGSSDENFEKYKRSQAIARAHGFAYRNIAEVAELPLEDIVSRVEMVARNNTKANQDALLGGAPLPQTRLSECLDLYWSLIRDRLTEKTDFEARKYKVPRQTAFEQFMEIIGDKALFDICRTDILTFRAWLMERVAGKEITGGTANKRLTAVKDILTTVGRSLELQTEFGPLFAETKFANPKEQREPFPTRYIKDTFIDGKALENLNEDARLLFMMMIETGARPKELIGLLPEDYLLDDDVPHIWIRKNRIRGLKVPTTERRIPLAGVALTAAKIAAPKGLLRYQAKPDHASGAIGKFLRENELLPSDRHSLYSLRHSFKDRLREVEAPEELIDELMGHTRKQPAYGSGRSLEQKHKWLRRIAFQEQQRPPP